MKFHIEPQKVKKNCTVLSDSSSNLASKATSVGNIKDALILSGVDYDAVRDALDICVKNLSRESKYANSLSLALKDIVSEYETTEQDIFNHITKAADKRGHSTGGDGTGNGMLKPEHPDKQEDDGSSKRGFYFDPHGPKGSGETTFGAEYERSKDRVDGEWSSSFGIEAGAEGECSVGGFEAGYEGDYVNGKISAEAFYVTGGIGAGMRLFDDGKFSPQAQISGEASVSAVHGEAEATFGTENNNAHVNAEGDLGTAYAEANAGVGVIENDDGTTTIGAEAEVKVGAYAAQGEVSGGITIFGVEINGSVGGGVGGAEFQAGGSVTTDGVSGEIGLGFLVGGDISISVDWSNFELPW